MPTKYYDKIFEAQRAQKPADQLPPFDPERLRSKGITGRLAGQLLENPRWLLRLIQRLKPNCKLGPIVLVSKNADVREVLERQDVFETPFGPEMTEMAGGANFILGMRDGEAYRRMKSAALTAFPVDEVESAVRPIAARHSREIMLRATSGFDVISKILKIVPVRICRDYYGLVIEDEEAFADRAIALSSLFFADFFGSPDTRELAVVAAAYMRATIDRSIVAVRQGAISAKTPLARLVAFHDADPDRLTLDQIHSIMTGMVTGFMPTNLLGGGNCLDFVLSRRDAQDTIEEAIAAGDDQLLDRAIVEAMRFKPINVGPLRYAREDAIIAKGTSREYRIRKGSTLIPLTLAAMFDPDAVENPEVYDPTRPASIYMVFGHGIHWCIGAAIAKVQIAEAFRVIFAKQNVRRAPGKAGKLRRRGAFPESLAVAFDMAEDCRTVEHAMVTLCLPVSKDVDLAELRNSIGNLGNPCQTGLREKIDRTGIIHFSSLALVCDGEKAGPGIGHPAHLVWEFSADGSADSAIEALALATEKDIRPVFQLACGLSAESSLEAFLKQHEVRFSSAPFEPCGLAFSGTPGHSIRRIRAEANLESTLSSMIWSLRGQAPRHAAGVLQAVRQRLAEAGNHDWAFQPAESLLEKPGGTTGNAIKGALLALPVVAILAVLVGGTTLLNYYYVLGGGSSSLTSRLLTIGTSAVLAVLGLSIVAAAIGGLLVWLLRRKEKSDPATVEQIPLDRYREITERENRSAQNHLTGISVMKAGRLRRLALQMVFLVVTIVVRHVFRPGHLADINTIHFARWVLVPGTNKLVFFSNYGGSWESYLEDFITKAHEGLTGVWSNTIGFPATKFLFWKGAEDGDRFKRWARLQQAPTLFWYSAYPEINTRRIRINSAIRQGLARAESESEAQAWLDLFGSLPRPASVLETNEIQSIVFGPMGTLERAEMIGFSVPPDINMRNRKDWLDWLAENLSFGDKKPEETAMIAAFGPDGLVRLGLGDKVRFSPISDFPPAFRQGMSDGARSRILDDSGLSGPENWEWGNSKNPVDVAVICYASNARKLSALTKELLAKSESAGLKTATRLHLVVNRSGDQAIEHFGFVDGISQPLIRGTPRALGAGNSMHVIEPGEFLLGYGDERRCFPPSPLVPAFTDRHSVLPAPEGIAVPAGGTGSAPAMRDFGRNGSFLVIRQIEQHVDNFNSFCGSAAKALKEKLNPREEVTPQLIAAKMVGRWQDGTSLVRNPYGAPGKPIDNDFTFGAEDPQGLRCPLGSHIRRGNPRDSLGLDRERQLELSKRHRILRVGRSYERKRQNGKGVEKGLLFMCLNADIERQFEFMQQTWISASAFHGLQTERDPLIGNPDREDRFTIPTENGALIVSGLKNFTTLHGGGYFFMPSRSALHYLASQA